jgi:hypothetical protein
VRTRATCDATLDAISQPGAWRSLLYMSKTPTTLMLSLEKVQNMCRNPVLEQTQEGKQTTDMRFTQCIQAQQPLHTADIYTFATHPAWCCMYSISGVQDSVLTLCMTGL